jgi:hypothetical protein
MRVATLICSESFSLDQASNRVSIFHIMDGISATVFPVVVRGMSLYVLWEREQHDPATFQYVIKIMLETEQLARLTAQGDFKGHTRARVIGNIQGFRLPGPGRIRVVIEFGGTDLAQWEIDARSAGSPPAQPPADTATTQPPADTAIPPAPAVPAPVEAPETPLSDDLPGAQPSSDPPRMQAQADPPDARPSADQPPALPSTALPDKLVGASPSGKQAHTDLPGAPPSGDPSADPLGAAMASSISVPAVAPPPAPSRAPRKTPVAAPRKSQSQARKKLPAKTPRKTPSRGPKK